MINEKIQVVLTPEMFVILDAQRGTLTRSAYARELLWKAMKKVEAEAML